MEVFRNKVDKTHRIIQTEHLIKKINPKSVLEIGAGDYSFESIASELSGLKKWDKLDFSPPCDIQLDINKEDVVFPINNASYDLIIITEVLEHLLWPQSVLKECRRILTDSGNIIGSVPNIVSFSYRIKWLLGGIPSCAACGNLPSGIGLTTYLQEDGKIIAGHVIDFNKKRLMQLFSYCLFPCLKFYSVGLFWGRQILPPILTPTSFSSNLLFVASKG